MIDFTDKVMLDDLNEATMEDQRIRDSLRLALMANIAGDYDEMKTYFQVAKRSLDRVDKLKERKKDFDLAREFIKPDIFWEQVRRMNSK